MKKYIVGFIVGLLVLAGYIAGGATNDKFLGGGTVGSCQVSLFSGGGTASTTSVGTGNNVLLPTSTARSYLSIFNDGEDSVSINFGIPAVAGEGYTLAASSTLVISQCADIYTRSSVHATMSSGGGSADLRLFFNHTAQ